MKRTASLLFIDLLLGACTATADITSEPSVVVLQTNAEPQLPEDAPKSAEGKSTGNTYREGGCIRALERDLSTLPTPEGWDERLITARTENEAAGLPAEPDIPNSTNKPPFPDIGVISDVTRSTDINVACLVMFDLLADGTPRNPLTHCTNEAFADLSKAALMSSRFEPPGKILKGLITNYTVCTLY